MSTNEQRFMLVEIMSLLLAWNSMMTHEFKDFWKTLVCKMTLKIKTWILKKVISYIPPPKVKS